MDEPRSEVDKRRGPHAERRKYTPEQDDEIAARRRAGETMTSLVREYGGSLVALRASLRRSGIVQKPGRARWREFTPEQVTEMATLWESGASQRAIAKRFGTDQAIISRLIIQMGHVPVRRYSKARRERHNWWRGGRITLHGYDAVLLEPGSPYESMMVRTGYVLEHRLVMAKALGRPLRRDETVHHINGDRTDNRLENLQLRQGGHGNGQAMQCLNCGSHNIGPVPIASDQPSIKEELT